MLDDRRVIAPNLRMPRAARRRAIKPFHDQTGQGLHPVVRGRGLHEDRKGEFGRRLKRQLRAGAEE